MKDSVTDQSPTQGELSEKSPMFNKRHSVVAKTNFVNTVNTPISSNHMDHKPRATLDLTG